MKNLLFFFIFLFFLYVLTLYMRKFYCWGKGLPATTADARSWLNGMIKTELRNLFPAAPPAPIEPAPDALFIGKCKLALNGISVLSSATDIPHSSFSEYLQQPIHGVIFDVTSLEPCEKLNAAATALETTARSYLLSVDYDNPRTFAFYEQYADYQFYFFVLYALYPDTQNRLDALIQRKAAIASKAVTDAAAPITNPDLEQELRDLLKEEKGDAEKG